MASASHDLRKQPDAPPRLEPRVEISCPVCAADRHRPVASAGEIDEQRKYLVEFHRRRLRTRADSALEDRADFTQDYSTNIVSCAGCGLVYRDPRPPDAAIAEAYAGDTYGEERLEALFDSQLELFRPKARELARWLRTPQPVVLEIGSFVGGFLAACGELGWDAHGIDPGEEVAAFCEAQGLAVLREKVDDLGFPPAAADCVAIWNTFDQLPDPHPTLASAQRCLRAGGILVIRVPSGRCFESCMQRLGRLPAPAAGVVRAAMAWNNLMAFPYLYGHSLCTLDRLAGGYGFVRVDARGDVLTRLADEQTKRWAAWEEMVLKSMWKVAFRARGAADAAPWFDVVYRKPA